MREEEEIIHSMKIYSNKTYFFDFLFVIIIGIILFVIVPIFLFEFSIPILTVLFLMYVIFICVEIISLYMNYKNYPFKGKKYIPLIKLTPEGMYIYNAIEGALVCNIGLKKSTFIPWNKINKIIFRFRLGGTPSLRIKQYTPHINEILKTKPKNFPEKIKYFLDSKFSPNKKWRYFYFPWGYPEIGAKKKIINYMNKYKK
ncbi:MAG: hypothetical protein ABIA74_03455 [bacterium]